MKEGLSRLTNCRLKRRGHAPSTLPGEPQFSECTPTGSLPPFCSFATSRALLPSRPPVACPALAIPVSRRNCRNEAFCVFFLLSGMRLSDSGDRTKGLPLLTSLGFSGRRARVQSQAGRVGFEPTTKWRCLPQSSLFFGRADLAGSRISWELLLPDCDLRQKSLSCSAKHD